MMGPASTAPAPPDTTWLGDGATFLACPGVQGGWAHGGQDVPWGNYANHISDQ